METVGDAIFSNGYDTGVAKGLSLQVLDELLLLAPNALASLRGLNIRATSSEANRMLQPAAYRSLERLLESKKEVMELRFDFRTSVQQRLLVGWGERFQRFAEPVGYSLFEDGLTLHVVNFDRWQRALERENWIWLGKHGPSCFHYGGSGARNDLGQLGVLAFQKLWNRFHPLDSLREDGVFGLATKVRMDQSPLQGFSPNRLLYLAHPPLRGDDVSFVQLHLTRKSLLTYSNHTGIYDKATASAVEAFQRQFGLYVDGVVGPSTLKALNQTHTFHRKDWSRN